MIHTLHTNNINLTYFSWGQPGKIPVLLLHGLADQGLVWEKVAQGLGDDFQVVAPDLRGHGDSDKPPSGYRSDDVIADLQGLMAHLGWERCHLVGHSWGGKVASIWACDRPEQFYSLTLVDPFFIGKLPRWMKLTFPILYKTLSFLKVLGHFPNYDAATEVARKIKEYSAWGDFEQTLFRRAMVQLADGQWTSKFVTVARNEIFEDSMVRDGFTRSRDLPSLLILPEAGLNRMAWQTAPCDRFLTQLETVQVPGNHWAMVGEPAAFTATLNQFLRHHAEPQHL